MPSNETQELEDQENILTSLRNSSKSISPKKPKQMIDKKNISEESTDFFSDSEAKLKSPAKKVAKIVQLTKKSAGKSEDKDIGEEKKPKTAAKKKAPAKKSDSQKKAAKKTETEKKTTKKLETEKKTKKPAKKDNEPSKEEIIDLIISLNRPFSVQDLLITLKNSIGKAALTKYLSEFEKKELIVSKNYNKTVIYCPKQSDEPINEEELLELDSQINQLKEKNGKLKEEIQEKNNFLAQILQFQDDLSLKKEIIDLKNYIEKNILRIQGLKSGGKIDEKEMNELEINFKKSNLKLKEIKSKFFTVVDALCDGMGLKRKEFYEEAGLEM
ncbi:Tat binding 1-interacting protein [Tubulinosema ratisbonensis]|uniref:Tat binding 1-interacting protein n=1 Tax=Tubulinosema ratisbonensis TaxID=291195 RepID=A0A437AKH5_9MICR|nr:Tat binding 1-interacting protein [Tubulinosema ratisbonensis]